MTKDFVPYEQALALKKLGFDEHCFGRWLIITEWEAPTGEIRLQLGAEAESYDKNQCTAPLYQQAFRWFREKYGLDSIVQPTYSPKYQYRMFHIEGKTKVQIYGDYMGKEFNTYEEAELECLKKLIKTKQ